MKRALGGLLALIMAACGSAATPDPTTTSAPSTTTSSAAGQQREDMRGVAQVLAPAGCFTMGTTSEQEEYARALDAPDWATSRITTEQPTREVCITRDYWIDRFEVTNSSFQQFIDAGGYESEEYWSEDGWDWLTSQPDVPIDCPGGPDHPRVCVTWFEAQAYATWRGGRLPTEAEWELAARGPDSLIFPWGNEWDPELANVVDSTALRRVGSIPGGASWVGALDMAGNAMEWVSDWYSVGYDSILDQTEDPTGPDSGRIKVEKGGWWGSNPVVTRSAYRHFEDPPNYQDGHIGFRVVTPD